MKEWLISSWQIRSHVLVVYLCAARLFTTLCLLNFKKLPPRQWYVHKRGKLWLWMSIISLLWIDKKWESSVWILNVFKLLFHRKSCMQIIYASFPSSLQSCLNPSLHSRRWIKIIILRAFYFFCWLFYSSKQIRWWNELHYFKYYRATVYIS